jgi:hypothetical protein
MARLYANENFPLPAIEELRRLGHDVLTSYESGRAGQAVPDEDVLAFAVAEARILITLNRKHFVRLHQRHLDNWYVLIVLGNQQDMRPTCAFSRPLRCARRG